MNELKNILAKILKHNYANFKGRADRREFWLFAFMQYIYLTVILLVVYFIFILGIIFMAAKNQGSPDPGMPGVLLFILGMYGVIFLALLPILVPSLAVTVRRLHDTNRSGWWLLLSFIPIGGIFVVFFLIGQGTKGANRYGDDPRIQEYREYLKSVDKL